MSRTSTTRSRSAGFAEAVRQRLAPRFVPDVRLPLQEVGCRAGHHDLYASLIVVGAVPIGTQAYELLVKVDADAPAHADDHRLAIEGF